MRQSWKQWVGFALLLGATYQYATASAKARALQIQLDAALDSIVTATEAHGVQKVATDSLIALQDSAQAADTAAVGEAAVTSDEASSEAVRALREVREAARGLPAVEAALDRAEDALAASEEARLVERATSAAAIFAGQQRERTLTNQLLRERSAAETEISRINTALDLAIRESDAWEQAAKPGALTQAWRQGRAAAVAVAIVLAVR